MMPLLYSSTHHEAANEAKRLTVIRMTIVTDVRIADLQGDAGERRVF
jgi:hypothetical protein